MERRDFLKDTVIGGSFLGLSSLARAGEAASDASVQVEKKEMVKKGLVICASRTGNTMKVAERFKSTFEKNGWQCDLFHIKQTIDVTKLPFDFKAYDLVCIGSGIRLHAPYVEMLTVIRRPFYGRDTRPMLKTTEGIALTPEEQVQGKQVDAGAGGHHKIVIGADAKKFMVFGTYAGFEFGPDEIQPALDWLALETKHLNMQPVGKFCCPGEMKMGNAPNAPKANPQQAGNKQPAPAGFHKDMSTRPNEKDLMRAELYLEELLEQFA
jgi:hypothetical protein